MTARRWVALLCIVIGLSLLIVGVVYADWLAIALGLLTALFGVTQVRRR